MDSNKKCNFSMFGVIVTKIILCRQRKILLKMTCAIFLAKLVEKEYHFLYFKNIF